MNEAIASTRTDASIRFDILSKLAEGGMAEILLARVTAIEGFSKFVVLKRMLPSMAGDPELVKMFLDEARLAAQLHHQNIAQVHAIGAEEGSYFFSMEYLHGIDLRDLRGPRSMRRQLPLHIAMFIAGECAAGLNYAHDKCDDYGRSLGIVHRDVSPSNVFLTYDGAVKVVDFGIASAEERFTRSRNTGFKGKILYMSPEQASQEPVDRRSDVYSLGAVIYEMVANRRPFEPDRAPQLVLDDVIAGRFPRPMDINPSVPEQLDRIICRAMSRDPDRRHPTCADLHGELDEFSRHRGLTLSSRSLSDFLADTVGRRPEPWLEMSLEPTERVSLHRLPSLETVTGSTVSGVGLSELLVGTSGTEVVDEASEAARSQHRGSQPDAVSVETRPPRTEVRARRGRAWLWVSLLVLLVAMAGTTAAIYQASMQPAGAQDPSPPAPRTPARAAAPHAASPDAADPGAMTIDTKSETADPPEPGPPTEPSVARGEHQLAAEDLATAAAKGADEVESEQETRAATIRRPATRSTRGKHQARRRGRRSAAEGTAPDQNEPPGTDDGGKSKNNGSSKRWTKDSLYLPSSSP